MIRVGWLSTYDAVCGIAEYSRHLLHHVDPHECNVTVYAEQTGTPSRNASGVTGSWERHSSLSLASLAARILSDGIDCLVVQFHFGFFRASHMNSFLTRLQQSGVHTFVLLHHILDPEDSTAHMAESLGLCDAVLVHTLHDVALLHEMGLADNVIHFPHGALARKFRDTMEQRERLGLTGYAKIIGSYGFLLPHKGVRELIRSLPMILQQFPGTLLLLVNAAYPTAASSEERYACLQEISALGLQRNVVLVNDFLDPQESLFLLEACDVLVFPYQRSLESHSGAICHGMASGRPVLATEIPIFEELRGAIQFLPGKGSVEIAQGILHFLRDPSLGRKVCEGQVRWLEEHDWNRLSIRLQAMIKSAASGRHDDNIS